MWMYLIPTAAFLLATAVAGSATTRTGYDFPHNSIRRSLTGAAETIASEQNFRQCGKVIDTVYPGDTSPKLTPTNPVNELNYAINAIIQFLGEFFSSPAVLPLTYDDYYGIFLDAVGRDSSDPAEVLYLAQYGIKVVKVCGSCRDYRPNNKLKRVAYREYCGSGVYGRNATFSGVALVPVEKDGTLVKGALKGAVTSPSIQTDAFQVASVQWPSPEVGGVGAMIADLGLYYNFVPAMMAASTGRYVGLIPDNVGYGESSDCFKGIFVRKSYQTSLLPLWFSTQDLVSEMSEYKTELVDKAIVSGQSEGGYGSLAGAEALDDIGVEIILAQAGAPAKVEASISNTVGDIITSELDETFSYTFVMIGSSYSSSRPDLPNSGIPGQGLFKDTARPRYVNWAQANLETPDMRLLINNDFGFDGNEPLKMDGVNPAVLSSVEKDGSICENPSSLESLCAAISENEILDTLPTIQYPVQICHSPFDQLIPFNSEEYAVATAVNDLVTLTPTLDAWKGIASPQTLTNIYRHEATLGPCLLLQGWTLVDDQTTAEMSGRHKLNRKIIKGSSSSSSSSSTKEP